MKFYQAKPMRLSKFAAVLAAVLLCIMALAVPASAAVPDVYPDITAAERTDSGDIRLTITVYNRKDSTIDGFALYDWYNVGGGYYGYDSTVIVNGKRYNIGKYLKITVKPHTAKRVRITLHAGLPDSGELRVKYRLYYSCWCGKIYCYGRVTGETS